MGKHLKTYYDFADNDYKFFMDAHERGLVGNAMGALAQGICEKYLKHIVSEYIIVNTLEENANKTEVLKTHNLSKLSRYLMDRLPEMKVNKSALNIVNGLYFTTRYPGEESLDVTKDDICEYVEAVNLCKDSIDKFLAQRQRQRAESMPGRSGGKAR